MHDTKLFVIPNLNGITSRTKGNKTGIAVKITVIK